MQEVFSELFLYQQEVCTCLSYGSLLYIMYYCTIPAPPSLTNVTTWLMNASSVRVAWQWTSSDPASNCFNTTTVTYHPEGGSESSLQLSDPAATEATLTDLQCMQHKLHHHCGGHCWRIQEGGCSNLRTVFVPLHRCSKECYDCIMVAWEVTRKQLFSLCTTLTCLFSPSLSA